MSISSLNGLEFSLYNPRGRVVLGSEVVDAMYHPFDWVYVGSGIKFSEHRRQFKLVYIAETSSFQKLLEELSLKESTARVPEGQILLSMEPVLKLILKGQHSQVAVADLSWQNKTRRHGKAAGTPHYPALHFRNWSPDVFGLCSILTPKTFWVVEIVR